MVDSPNMKKISVHFDVGTPVKIKELKIKGFVCAIYVSLKGVEYRIRYIFNGEPKELYFYAEDLELVEGEPILGFRT